MEGLRPSEVFQPRIERITRIKALPYSFNSLDSWFKNKLTVGGWAPPTTFFMERNQPTLIKPDFLDTPKELPFNGGRGTDVWAMLEAAYHGNLQTIETLVVQAPGLANCNYDYVQPIHLAVIGGHVAIVDLLLRAGANRDLPAEPAWAKPAAWAVHRGYAEIVRMMR